MVIKFKLLLCQLWNSFKTSNLGGLRKTYKYLQVEFYKMRNYLKYQGIHVFSCTLASMWVILWKYSKTIQETIIDGHALSAKGP